MNDMSFSERLTTLFKSLILFTYILSMLTLILFTQFAYTEYLFSIFQHFPSNWENLEFTKIFYDFDWLIYCWLNFLLKTHFTSEFFQFDSIQWFCKNICLHFFSWTIYTLYSIIFNVVINKMISSIYMFCSCWCSVTF